MTPTQQEQNILYILQKHKGQDNAITFSDLAVKARMNERELRSTVADMITIKHQPIGTSSSAGYYMLTNKSECKHCGSEAWSRSHKNRERGQAYDVIEDKYFSKTEQISLGGM